MYASLSPVRCVYLSDCYTKCMPVECKTRASTGDNSISVAKMALAPTDKALPPFWSYTNKGCLNDGLNACLILQSLGLDITCRTDTHIHTHLHTFPIVIVLTQNRSRTSVGTKQFLGFDIPEFWFGASRCFVDCNISESFISDSRVMEAESSRLLGNFMG